MPLLHWAAASEPSTTGPPPPWLPHDRLLPRPSYGTGTAALAAGDNGLFVVSHCHHHSIQAIFRCQGGLSSKAEYTNWLPFPWLTFWDQTRPSLWPRTPSITPPFPEVIPCLHGHFPTIWRLNSIYHHLHHPPHHLYHRSRPAATPGSPTLFFSGDGHSQPYWCPSARLVVLSPSYPSLLFAASAYACLLMTMLVSNQANPTQ